MLIVGENDRAADIAAGCMKDAATRWYLANKDQIDRWYTNGNNTNFKTKFLKKFATDIRQDAWHQIYRRLEQGDQTVDEYAIAFEKALERIDSNYPVAMVRKDFEKGVKQQYQMPLALVPSLNTWSNVAEAARKLEGTLLSSAATQVFHTTQVEPTITTTINNLENRIQQWENRWNPRTNNQYRNQNRGNQNRPLRCNTCQKNGHTTVTCSETRCNQCNRKGHIARNCPNDVTNNNNQQNNNYQRNQQSNN